MEGVNTDGNTWIRRFHPASAGAVRLACFPHAGGSASFFFPVSQALQPSVEVLAVQYPGRQDRRREPCVTDLGTLADLAYEALRDWADRPIALFGHSMGAIVAFEVARRLEQRLGVEPAVLFASGRRAPSRHRTESVHRRDDDGVVRELQLLGGTDAVFLQDEELLQMSLPAIRGDYRAIERYQCSPGAEVSCPVVALVGDSDPRTTIEEARAWSAHTSSEFDIQVFPGGHFFLAEHPDRVIEAISGRLPTPRLADG